MGLGILAACSSPTSGSISPAAPGSEPSLVASSPIAGVPAASASATASVGATASVKAEPSASVAAPSAPVFASWESVGDPENCIVGFAEGLRAQQAERGDSEREWVVPGLGVRLRTTLPSPHFVVSSWEPALVGYAQVSFDCGHTALRVARVGVNYPGDAEGLRDRGRLFKASKITDTKLADGLVVLGEGQAEGAKFMVFVARKLAGREIYCEGTSRSAAGRDAMRSACESLRAD